MSVGGLASDVGLDLLVNEPRRLKAQAQVLDEAVGMLSLSNYRVFIANHDCVRAVRSQSDGFHRDTETLLGELKTFSAELPFDMRGLAIENSEAIRTAHNAFARPEPFVSEEKRATADDDVFHFVAYVPSGGKVYELDGLKAGPIDLGSFEDSWLPVARSAIEARIQKYAASEIKFNLMAIVRDKRAALEDAKAAADAATAAELDAELAREHAKRADWAAENVRRHHNYVPFVVDLLKVLAEQGKLGAMMDDAKAKASTDANKRQKV